MPTTAASQRRSVGLVEIGERLRAAMKSRGLTQKEVAVRAGLEESTVSNIAKGKSRQPNFDTVERMVNAIGISWAELFEEARLELTESDAQLAEDARELLGRLVAADRALKEQRGGRIQPMARRRTRTRIAPPGEVAAGPGETYPDVYNLPNEKIPADYHTRGARRAYRVDGDSMIGAGLYDGATIFVRPTVDLASADGKVVVVRWNGSEYVKKLDLRGGIALHSENPIYEDIIVDEDQDDFALIGLVVD